MQNMASRPRSFHDDLADQLSFFDCDPILREIADYIIHNLDERGLFLLDLQDVVRDFNGRATWEQAEEALRMVQRLDPPGVGHATSASACCFSSLPRPPAMTCSRC